MVIVQFEETKIKRRALTEVQKQEVARIKRDEYLTRL